MRLAQKLLAEALQLDDEQRAALALSLMDSLSPPDPRDESSWIEEIERRARRALSGEEPGVEVDGAIDSISRDLWGLQRPWGMKTRTADRVVAWSTWLLLPWVLSGCGEQVFEARVGERWVSFQDVKTQLLPQDASARTLRACGLHDPLPNAIDDETTMCLSLVLDLERVDAAGAGVVLEVDGVARLTQASDASTLTFEPGAGHAPAVLSGHADLLCFAMPATEPVTQRLLGRITLRRVTPTSLMGRVELSLEGELAGRQCSASSGPAVFDFGFDVER